ncbi:MAG TPA: LacI family transcriptional regulator, partial [Chloroflexi bacterium]|nr:LacI family transcriptional regulator [Chloroflexota bacterium]
AILTGPREVSTAVERALGYRQALEEAGIPVKGDLIRFGPYTQQAGYAMTLSILSLSPRPTAIFAGNNFIAVGALRALREAGLQVPEDVSLVAYDDLPPNFLVEPFLTVAAQRAYEMGQVATQLLLTRLAEQEPGQPQEIVLPTELIIRRSCGNPKNMDQTGE